MFSTHPNVDSKVAIVFFGQYWYVSIYLMYWAPLTYQNISVVLTLGFKIFYYNRVIFAPKAQKPTKVDNIIFSSAYSPLVLIRPSLPTNGHFYTI